MKRNELPCKYFQEILLGYRMSEKKVFFKYAYLVFQEQYKKEIRDINKNIHQDYKTCLTLSKILKSSAAHLITKEENKKD